MPARIRLGHELARNRELFRMPSTGSAFLGKNKSKKKPRGKCIHMWKPQTIVFWGCTAAGSTIAVQLLLCMRSSVGRFDHSCCCTTYLRRRVLCQLLPYVLTFSLAKCFISGTRYLFPVAATWYEIAVVFSRSLGGICFRSVPIVSWIRAHHCLRRPPQMLGR